MALNPAELALKIKKIYKAKKRDDDNIGTGLDIKPPTFYVKAPEAVRPLLGGSVGYPGQRVGEFVGGTNCGKTTFGMLAMVEAQKGYYDVNEKFVAEPINVVLVDTEKKFSQHRFKKMGGNPEMMFKIDATTLEEAYFGIDQTLAAIYDSDPEAKVLVIFDSLGNTPAGAEADAEADESVAMSIAAKVNNRNIRSLVARYFSKKDICMIFINQNYAKMGPMAHGKTNKGGQGIDLACANIWEFTKVGDIAEEVNGIKTSRGITTKIKSTKCHNQLSETRVQELQCDIYAWEVKGLTKYKIKNKAEWVGDECRIQVIKAKPKDDQVTIVKVMDNPEAEEHMKPQTFNYEELTQILTDGNYQNVSEGE